METLEAKLDSLIQHIRLDAPVNIINCLAGSDGLGF